MSSPKPPAPIQTVLPEAFRQAMSEVTAAVHVITTLSGGNRAGLTASAVTSLSAEPPMMIACIHGDSRTLVQIEHSRIFCINTLSGEDQEVAETFAGRKGLSGEARFAAGDWQQLATGAPALSTALTCFDCRLLSTETHATHRVIIGEVVAIGGRGHGPGLIYRNRRFGSF